MLVWTNVPQILYFFKKKKKKIKKTNIIYFYLFRLAALYKVVPSSTRGTTQGILSMLTAVGNLAPILVGALVGGSLGTYVFQ